MQNHVLDYLDNIVKEKPNKIAFSNGTDNMTFFEVFEQSNSIGTYLWERKICRKPVVVFMNKHPKEVTAFFGVIRGGNFYVPIDEEMPRTRIELILQNVQPEIIICDEATEKVARHFEF